MTMSRRVLVCLLLAAALHHGFVWLAQRAILFPGAHSGAPWGRAPENAVTITAGGSRALLVPARGSTGDPAPLVVYGHGNAEFAEDFFLLPEPYTAAGFHVLVLEYRGYGDVAGSPSEDALVADSVALIEAACARPDVDGERVDVRTSMASGSSTTAVPWAARSSAPSPASGPPQVSSSRPPSVRSRPWRAQCSCLRTC